jgi:hypothetical protein
MREARLPVPSRPSILSMSPATARTATSARALPFLWVLCAPEEVGHFSALASFTLRLLRRKAFGHLGRSMTHREIIDAPSSFCRHCDEILGPASRSFIAAAAHCYCCYFIRKGPTESPIAPGPFKYYKNQR